MSIKEIPNFKWRFEESKLSLKFNIGDKYEFDCVVSKNNDGISSEVLITLWSSMKMEKVCSYLNNKLVPCEYANEDEYLGEIIYLRIKQNSMRDGKIFVEDWLINALSALKIEID